MNGKTYEQRLNRKLIGGATLSLVDAMKTASENGLEPVAFWFENQNLVGEYSPSTGISTDAFLSDFLSSYGVEPAVTALVIEARVEQVRTQGGDVNSNLGAELPRLEPQAILTDSAIGKLLSQGVAQEERRAAAAKSLPTRWDPDIVQHMIAGAGPNDAYHVLSGHYVWQDLATSPQVLQAHHGLEFEINIHSDSSAISGSGRPVCLPTNYKDVPFAKNYGWTWSAYVGSPNPPGGTVTNLAALGVYADYNDLSDECNRNSIGIGLAIPQDIPLPYGSSAYYFGWQVLAPTGVQKNDPISAVVQSVSTHLCETATWMALTDCMGVYSSGYGVNRPVLAAWRNWRAPDRCWNSLNYGTTAPVSFTCPW